MKLPLLEIYQVKLEIEIRFCWKMEIWWMASREIHVPQYSNI